MPANMPAIPIIAYIIGGSVVFLFIVIAVILKIVIDKQTRKLLAGKKYALIEVGIKATDTNYRAYRLKEVLMGYGMSTHDSGIKIECRIIRGAKDKDTRLKPHEFAFEIVAKTSDGLRTIGKPYFRKFKKIEGKDLAFTYKALSAYPQHLAKGLKP
jgi:hypothetical protein